MKITSSSRKMLSALLAFFLFFSILESQALTTYASDFTGITASTISYESYEIGPDPAGLNITYYNGIYSRGFSWMTDANTDITELYIKEGTTLFFDASDKISDDYCSSTEITDSKATDYGYNQHKAYVTGLSAGKTYSYKIGAPEHYKTGIFTVAKESDSITNINILTFSDAQTRQGALLYQWENTAAAGFNRLNNPDFVLYNGDQFDATMNSPSTANSIPYAYRYGFGKDTVAPYLASVPYMAAMGNHDYYTSDTKSAILCGDGTTTSMYYSFDYGFAHFSVLNCNGNGSCNGTTPKQIINDQKIWLDADLKAANANSDIKWIIVMMHCGPASTGDHSAEIYTKNTAAEFTEIISKNHVDLVLQGHDHTYSKTLPYKWDTDGKTTTYGNTAIVNYDVATVNYQGTVYDVNPNGTYYVTTGASGHRAGVSAGEEAGVFADVTVDTNATDGSGLAAVNENKTYLTNYYKTVVGTCNVGCTVGTTMINKGDPATCNIDAQMFGTLCLTQDTLQYTFYTVTGSSVQILDTLNVLKSDSDIAGFTNDLAAANDASSILNLLQKFWADTGLADFFSAQTWSNLRSKILSILSNIESNIKSALATLSSGSTADAELVAVQSSITNGTFNARFIAGAQKTEAELANYKKIGFEISVDTGTGYESAKTIYCKELYSYSVLDDGIYQITNIITAESGESLFALTVLEISAENTVSFKIKPFMIEKNNNKNYGSERIVIFEYGLFKSVE